jgi:pimeloyl-ACP methyl ester carboxylesterase
VGRARPAEAEDPRPGDLGLDDKALLPIQLEGIGEVGDDVELFPLKGVGHFAPWEAPQQVAAALRPFLLAM